MYILKFSHNYYVSVIIISNFSLKFRGSLIHFLSLLKFSFRLSKTPKSLLSSITLTPCLCWIFVLQDIVLSVENTVIYRIQALSLCSSQRSHLEFRVNRNNLELLTPLKIETISHEELQTQLAILDKAMKGKVATYLGGLPGTFSSVFKKYILNQIDSIWNI